MYNLEKEELSCVYGGAYFYTSFNLMYKIYRVIRIKLLMKKLFVD